MGSGRHLGKERGERGGEPKRSLRIGSSSLSKASKTRPRWRGELVKHSQAKRLRDWTHCVDGGPPQIRNQKSEIGLMEPIPPATGTSGTDWVTRTGGKTDHTIQGKNRTL